MSASSAQIARNRPYWLVRGVVLAGAIALGLWLNGEVGAYLATIQERAQTDVLGARAELARVFRWLAVGLFGGVALLGLHLLATARRALRAGQYPPPGAWSFGATRHWQGEPARRVARIMTGLSVALVLLACAGGGLSWYVASVLLACRAP
jgi:hypothetical protein